MRKMHLKVIVSITQPSKSPGWDGMGWDASKGVACTLRDGKDRVSGVCLRMREGGEEHFSLDKHSPLSSELWGNIHL